MGTHLRRRTQFSFILVAVVGLCVLACSVPALAAPADAQAKIDAGDYRGALKLIAEGLSGPDVSPADRAALLMLRAEAMIRLGESRYAADACTLAAQTTQDPKQAAIARATAALLRKSRNNAYKSIDIVAPESRQKAFAALYADTQHSLKPRVEAALRASSLQPSQEVLPSLLDLAAMEYLANGSAPNTKETLATLGAHARELMSAEIKRVQARVAQMSHLANSITGDDDGFGRRGLQIPEQRELRNDVAYLRQIQSTAQKARARARELGFDGSAWEPIIADAADAADQGDGILTLQP